GVTVPRPTTLTATGSMTAFLSVCVRTADSEPRGSTDLSRTMFGPARSRTSGAVQFVVPNASWNGPSLSEYQTSRTSRLSVARPRMAMEPFVARVLLVGQVTEMV